MEIEGRGFHTNLYAVRGVYSGGREGKSRIQWLRSMVGSPDLISIPGMFHQLLKLSVSLFKNTDILCEKFDNLSSDIFLFFC